MWKSKLAQRISLPHMIFIAVTSACIVGAFFIGWREYQNAMAIERANLNQKADTLLSSMQAAMARRESIVRTAGASFAPVSPLSNVIGTINKRLLDYIPDAYSFVWASQVPRSQAPSLLEAMRKGGISEPRLMGPARKVLGPDDLTDPLVVVFDVLPKTPQNLSSIGLNLASLPKPSEALRAAARQKDVAVTAPLTLVQLPGTPAIVFYMPVMAGENQIIGFLGMSFRGDTLVGPSMSSEAVRINDVSGRTPEILYARGEWSQPRPYVTRKLR